MHSKEKQYVDMIELTGWAFKSHPTFSPTPCRSFNLIKPKDSSNLSSFVDRSTRACFPTSGAEVIS